MRVLIVGFAPAAEGQVFKFSMLRPSSGGTKDFRLKVINAFFTGSIPADCKSLRPRMLMLTIKSLKST